MSRLAYTRELQEANCYFIERCTQLGMSVRIDAAGNLIARREGRFPELPAVACGSHLDTVYQGGRYDGTLGVAAAIEAVNSLHDKGIATKHPIEIISFACEESSRFGVSTIGSKAMTGRLDQESVARLKDRDGISVPRAFADNGLDFERIGLAARKSEELKVFLELHIEQGPVLENGKVQIGVVSGIASPTRLEVTVQGKASHSGTTPMNLRRDALLGAAEIALEVERAAAGESVHGTVATVGVCEVSPGAMNVVPGAASLMIDVRGTETRSKQAVIGRIYRIFSDLERRRGLTIEPRMLSDETPVHLAPEVIRSLCESCGRLGYSWKPMTSGAGHDAMNMAALCPTGLIFVPSRDGLSHHADEYTAPDELGVGAELLELELLKWADAIHLDRTEKIS